MVIMVTAVAAMSVVLVVVLKMDVAVLMMSVAHRDGCSYGAGG